MVFTKFFKGHHSTSKKSSGIGLAVCKEIIETHGGTITVKSKEGEGSTFTFDFGRVIIQPKKEFEEVHNYLKKSSNQQIADELFLSLGTIKNYISQLYRKMNVSSRHGLMDVLHTMTNQKMRV